MLWSIVLFLSAALYASSLLIGAESRATHAPVFVPLALPPGVADCVAFHDENACVAHGCGWRHSTTSAASSCYPADSDPSTKLPLDASVDREQFAIRNASVTDALFTAWKRFHGKQYGSTLEESERRAVFERHAEMVAAHNAQEASTFTMELNQFADLTWSEIQSQYLSAPQHCSATHTSNSAIQYGAAPVSRDWRSEGVVTRVKSQGVCGSCWAFSATGCVESHHAIKHGTQVLLSEQNLVDCAHAFNNHGCFGGLPSQAFEYIHYNGGIDTEASYRYKAWGGKCQFDQRHVGARVDAVVNITSRNEDELKAAVGAVGPVSIAFQSRLDMMFYKSGVYASAVCHNEETFVNHAVLAVGFGTTAGNGNSTPFWIVKNSWSDKWGMDGYFLIKRGVNMCGLADCASYVVIA